MNTAGLILRFLSIVSISKIDVDPFFESIIWSRQNNNWIKSCLGYRVGTRLSQKRISERMGLLSLYVLRFICENNSVEKEDDSSFLGNCWYYCLVSMGISGEIASFRRMRRPKYFSPYTWREIFFRKILLSVQG